MLFASTRPILTGRQRPHSGHVVGDDAAQEVALQAGAEPRRRGGRHRLASHRQRREGAANERRPEHDARGDAADRNHPEPHREKEPGEPVRRRASAGRGRLDDVRHEVLAPDGGHRRGGREAARNQRPLDPVRHARVTSATSTRRVLARVPVASSATRRVAATLVGYATATGILALALLAHG